MNKDQNLIFEAYTKIVYENGAGDNSVLEELEAFMRQNPETEQGLSPILSKVQNVINDLAMHYYESFLNDVEYGGLLNDLRDAFEELEAFMRQNPETEQGLSPILNDFLDIIKGLDRLDLEDDDQVSEIGEAIKRLSTASYEGNESREDYAQFDKTHDENEESSEGAINLLDQLKEEVPELEDKINQILSQVFDVVDILNQEPYADDPILGKAYGSLIDDHVRPMGTFKEDNEDFG